MSFLTSLIAAHGSQIGWALGIYAMVATIINRVWARPAAPPWLKVLHTVLIDYPAGLPSYGAKGLFGLPITIPYLTISQHMLPPAGPNQPKGFCNITFLLWMGLVSWFYVALLATLGCASGTDGLRQACANTDAVLMASYSTTTAAFRVDQANIRAGATAANLAQAQSRALAHAKMFSEALNGLDGIASSAKAICDLAPAIDAGLKKDVPSLMNDLIALSADIQKVVAQFRSIF